MTDNETMNDVSHTHPETGESFGSVYRRGPVAADGGSVAEDKSTADDVGRTMKDVDHTTDDAARDLWTRGTDRDSQHGANR